MYFSESPQEKLITVFANSLHMKLYVQHLVVKQFLKMLFSSIDFLFFPLALCLPHLVFIVFCDTSGSVLMSKHEFLEWQSQQINYFRFYLHHLDFIKYRLVLEDLLGIVCREEMKGLVQQS